MSASYKRGDHFTRAAKQAGFSARSVFKLEAIDARRTLLRPGQRVLDLGAAPGSWTSYAALRVGPRGHVVSVDIRPLAQAVPSHVTFHQADALALTDEALAPWAPFDVVMSDMAPNTTGSRTTDQARSAELFRCAVAMAERFGAARSSFVGKLFMGPEFELARARLRSLYASVWVERPPAVRKTSFECFLVGIGKRA